MRRLRFFALFLLAVAVAGCGTAAEDPILSSAPAEPQQATTSWAERYPAKGSEALVFGVRRLEVTAAGWSADVSIRNDTKTAFALGDSPSELAFGVMLFPDGDLEALQKATSLPAIRRARSIAPAPPARLEPGSTWRATITAPGALADGSYVRVTFGALRPVGKQAPEELDRPVVWITDHAYGL